MTTNLRDLILETDDSEIESIKSEIEDNISRSNEYMEKVKAVANSGEENALISDMEAVLCEISGGALPNYQSGCTDSRFNPDNCNRCYCRIGHYIYVENLPEDVKIDL